MGYRFVFSITIFNHWHFYLSRLNVFETFPDKRYNISSRLVNDSWYDLDSRFKFSSHNEILAHCISQKSPWYLVFFLRVDSCDFFRDSNQACTHIFGNNFLFPWPVLPSVVTLPRRCVSMHPTYTGTVQIDRIRIRDVIEMNFLARRWYGCWFAPFRAVCPWRRHYIVDTVTLIFLSTNASRPYCPQTLTRLHQIGPIVPFENCHVAPRWLRKSQIATVANDWSKGNAIHRKPYRRLGRSKPKKWWGSFDPL